MTSTPGSAGTSSTPSTRRRAVGAELDHRLLDAERGDPPQRRLRAAVAVQRLLVVERGQRERGAREHVVHARGGGGGVGPAGGAVVGVEGDARARRGQRVEQRRAGVRGRRRTAATARSPDSSSQSVPASPSRTCAAWASSAEQLARGRGRAPVGERALAVVVGADQVEAGRVAGQLVGEARVEALLAPGLEHRRAVVVVAEPRDERDLGAPAREADRDVVDVARVAERERAVVEVAELDHALAHHGDARHAVTAPRSVLQALGVLGRRAQLAADADRVARRRRASAWTSSSAIPPVGTTRVPGGATASTERR